MHSGDTFRLDRRIDRGELSLHFRRRRLAFLRILLHKLFNATCGVNKLLPASEKRMAIGADFNV